MDSLKPLKEFDVTGRLVVLWTPIKCRNTTTAKTHQRILLLPAGHARVTPRKLNIKTGEGDVCTPIYAIGGSSFLRFSLLGAG
jgi:hypothetical protein